MSAHIFLIRHAEAERPTIFHGYESNADLSDIGVGQARELAPIIAKVEPHSVISSGMLRAKRTAQPIADQCGLTLDIEELLHERKVGGLVGTSAKTEVGVWPETLRRWMDGDTAYTPDEAESYDAVRDRVLPVWDRIAQEHSGRRVVVVAHGIVIKILLLTLLPDCGPGEWTNIGRIRNCSVSELIGKGRDWIAPRIGEVPEAVEEVRRRWQTSEGSTA